MIIFSRSVRNFGFALAIALITSALAFSAGPDVPTLNAASMVPISRLTHANDAFNSGDYKKAAALYEEAVKLQPDNSSAYEGLGRSYERMAESSPFPGRLAGKARKSYQTALNLNPRNVEALQDLIQMHTVPVGVCYGNLDEAAVLIEQLNRIDPSLAAINRWRLQDAVRESRAPEMTVRCGYQKVVREAEKALAIPRSGSVVR